MMDENLMDFSVNEGDRTLGPDDTTYDVPSLMQTPVVVNSILKPSTRDNLIQLQTPVPKIMRKVQFETPSVKKVTPNRYEEIRELDEKENWIERTTVVLKEDHDRNLKNAMDILLDLVYAMPLSSVDLERNDSDEEEEGEETFYDSTETPQDEVKTKSVAMEISMETQATEDEPMDVDCTMVSVDDQDSRCLKGLSKSLSSGDSQGKKEGPGAVPTATSSSKLEECMKNSLESLFNGYNTQTGERTATAQTQEVQLPPFDTPTRVKSTSLPLPRANDEETDFLKQNNGCHLTDPKVNSLTENAVLPSTPQKSELNGSMLELTKTPNLEDGCSTALPEFVSENLQISVDTNDRNISTSRALNSPLKDDNPFMTKSKVANSPTQEKDPFFSKSKVENSPELEKDPFTTKSKVANSPQENGSFITKSEVGNSPELEKDPFTTKSKVVNSPTPENDPFVSKSKVANSPELEKDPFTIKSKVVNSPTQENGPFITNSKVANSPELEKDPFTTKSKVANSPIQENDPFITKSNVANSPTCIQENDPFITKSNVANSPTCIQENDPFTTKSKVANSPTCIQENDPFTTKSKVANSPTCIQENDPFTTKSKVANSPTCIQENDPFTTKSKVANSPTCIQENDPFTTKSKVANSPTCIQENDPFTTKSKVANSPTCIQQNDPFTTKSKVANSPIQENDPFTTKSKYVNSPLIDKDQISATTKNSGLPGATNGENSVLDLDTLNETLTKMDEATITHPNLNSKQVPRPVTATPKRQNVLAGKENRALTPGLQTLSEDFSEEEFKPASSDMFDEHAWDLLENFGKGGNSCNLARMSLFTIFDPLVDVPVNDPRRASIVAKRQSIIDARRNRLSMMGGDKSLMGEESLMLLGTPPQQRKSRCRPFLNKSLNITPKKLPSTPEVAEPLDLLCSNTPTGATSTDPPPAPTPALCESASATGIVEVLQYTQVDVDQMKQAMMLDFQAMKMMMEKQAADDRQRLEEELKGLRQQLTKEQDKIKEMNVVFAGFEELVEKIMVEKQEILDAKKSVEIERDQALEDTRSVEKAFADLHKRYEKLKGVLDGLRKNEEILTSNNKELREKLVSTQDKLMRLKEDAEGKLSKTSEEIKKLEAANEKTLVKLETTVKTKEMKIESLQKQLEQKVAENKELTELCEQLLAKV